MPSLAHLGFCLMTSLAFATAPVTAQGEEYPGLMAPSAQAEIGSHAPGVLDEVFVDRGDTVQKGQVIARLKNRVEAAEVELAAARMEFGRRKVERNLKLYQKQLLSGNEQDEHETESRVAELQMREAAERRDVRVIKAPMNGVVITRMKSPGEFVGEQPILSLATIDPLKVEVTVPVNRLGSVMKGMKARVKPEYPAGGEYEAEVTVVDSVVDAASGTFGVRLRLDNPAGTLHAGVKCTVRFVR